MTRRLLIGCCLLLHWLNPAHAQVLIKKEIYPDGSYALIETRDGVATGTAKEFDTDDSLLAEYGLTNGELDGTFLTYNPDGTLKSSEEYAEGQRHGLAKIYDERGYLQQVQRYEDGEFKELVPIHEAFEILHDISDTEVRRCFIEEQEAQLNSLLSTYWLLKPNSDSEAEWYVLHPVSDKLRTDESRTEIKNLGFLSNSLLTSPVGEDVYMAHAASVVSDGFNFETHEINLPDLEAYVCVIDSRRGGCFQQGGRNYAQSYYSRKIQELIQDEGDISTIPWIHKAIERPVRSYRLTTDLSSLYVAQTTYTYTRKYSFNSSYMKMTVLEISPTLEPRHVYMERKLACFQSTPEEMRMALQSDSNEG